MISCTSPCAGSSVGTDSAAAVVALGTAAVVVDVTGGCVLGSCVPNEPPAEVAVGPPAVTSVVALDPPEPLLPPHATSSAAVAGTSRPRTRLCIRGQVSDGPA